MAHRQSSSLPSAKRTALAAIVAFVAVGHSGCTVLVDAIIPETNKCLVGARRCVGDQAQQCDLSGQFAIVATCAAGACDGSTGECRGGIPCPPGATCEAPLVCESGLTDSNGTLKGGTCVSAPDGSPAPCEANTTDSNGSAAGGTCIDVSTTVEAGAACDPNFFDTNGSEPGGTCAPILASCTFLKSEYPSANDGVYRVDFDGSNNGLDAVNVYCVMTPSSWASDLPAGGWTTVAVYGTSGRPSSWTGNDYPRPGASHYGSASTLAKDLDAIRSGATTAIPNYSINAAALFAGGAQEALLYVGGSSKDFVTVLLPSSCNFFDGKTFCEENKATGLTATQNYRQNLAGARTTFTNLQACTTAHRNGAWPSDDADEFGLTLLEGNDASPQHCHKGSGTLGHEGMGRIFKTTHSSNGAGWNVGVESHWNPRGVNGSFDPQPGFILLRGPRPYVTGVSLSTITAGSTKATMTIEGRAFTSRVTVRFDGQTFEVPASPSGIKLSGVTLPAKEGRFPLKVTNIGGGLDDAFVVVVCPKDFVDSNGMATLGKCIPSTINPILCDDGFIDSTGKAPGGQCVNGFADACANGYADSNGGAAGGTCISNKTSPIPCDNDFIDSNGTAPGGRCVNGYADACDPGYVDTTGVFSPSGPGTCVPYKGNLAPCLPEHIDSNGDAPGGHCILTFTGLYDCDPGFKDSNGNAAGGTCIPQ